MSGLHIWFSMFVILAGSGIAVLAVVLKKRDDRLREALTELRNCREEEQRLAAYERMYKTPQQHSEPPAPKPAPVEVATAPAPQPKQEAPPQVAEPPVDRDSEARERNLAIRQAQGSDFVARPARRKRQNPPPELPKLDDINPKEALSDWLNRRAAARTTTQKPVATSVVEIAPAVEASEPIAAPVMVAKQVVEAPKPFAELTHEPETLPSLSNPSDVFVDEFLWESILGQSAIEKKPTPAANYLRFEVIQGTASGWQSGMQEEASLTQLIDSNKSFTGLAIAIGVGHNDGRAVSRETMLHIRQLVRSLLQGDDFACQIGDDEFLVLCRGAEAKRRLSSITESLWDFQLREIGSFSVLFSTGDAQVADESLREAVAAARTRLQQTRRARKMVSFDSVSPRKSAVI